MKINSNFDREEILRIIAELKRKELSNRVKQLLEQVEYLIGEYPQELDTYEESNVRFCDYFSFNIHGQEVLDTFDDFYDKEDKEDVQKQFILYAIFKNVSDILEIYEMAEESDYDDIEECFEQSIADTKFLIRTFRKIKTEEQENEVDMSFLTDNKYDIFFSGFSYKDIKGLQKQELKALIAKLRGDLSKAEVIRGAETIGHVKDKYKVPAMRIQLADDYRVAFIRRNNTTIIIGVDAKSGKDADYTRYDSIARDIDFVYEDLDAYHDGKLPKTSDHMKIVDYIKVFLQKEKKNSKNLTT